MKPNEKSIIINIREEIHTLVKELAARRGISMKLWVARAIIKEIALERDDEIFQLIVRDMEDDNV